ncbi:uncharacterized protein [Dermacentor albipictus]|uniref:uncharacterized protein n=1 Tax=Dermacentor albipictus TaxID=60249 RepID=UPI0038FD2A50
MPIRRLLSVAEPLIMVGLSTSIFDINSLRCFTSPRSNQNHYSYHRLVKYDKLVGARGSITEASGVLRAHAQWCCSDPSRPRLGSSHYCSTLFEGPADTSPAGPHHQTNHKARDTCVGAQISVFQRLRKSNGGRPQNPGVIDTEGQALSRAWQFDLRMISEYDGERVLAEEELDLLPYGMDGFPVLHASDDCIILAKLPPLGTSATASPPYLVSLPQGVLARNGSCDEFGRQPVGSYARNFTANGKEEENCVDEDAFCRLVGTNCCKRVHQC